MMSDPCLPKFSRSRYNIELRDDRYETDPDVHMCVRVRVRHTRHDDDSMHVVRESVTRGNEPMPMKPSWRDSHPNSSRIRSPNIPK